MGDENEKAKKDEKDSDGPVDTVKLAEENARLKSQIESISVRLEKLDAIDAERDKREEKKKEEERIKREGHDQVLAEKNKTIEETEEKLEAFRRRQLDRAQKLYSQLPETARSVIDPLQGKLDVLDWVDLIERHSEIATADSTDSRFMRPGRGVPDGERVVSKKAQEIFELLGRGSEMAKKLIVVKDKDEDTGAIHTKFTRHVKSFFADMNRPPIRRLDGRQSGDNVAKK